MGSIQYYQVTWQPVNQAICIFIIMTIVFCNVVSIKYIIVLLYHYVTRTTHYVTREPFPDILANPLTTFLLQLTKYQSSS